MEINSSLQGAIEGYRSFSNFLPEWAKQLLLLAFLSLLILIYAISIWKFYRFVSKKNIFELDLRKYNKSSNSFLYKFFNVLFYFIEYLLILPFLVFIWFSLFSIFLMALTKGLSLDRILMISAVVVASIRMAAYYKGDLSKDLAKLLPFTILGLAITSPNFFRISEISGGKSVYVYSAW